MKNRFFAVVSWLGVIAFMNSTYAQDTVAPRIEVVGKAALEEGQFVKCDYTYLPNGNGSQGYTREVMPFQPWLNDEYAQIGVRATLNGNLSAVIIPQIKLWNDTWDWTTLGENTNYSNPFIQHMTVSLSDAEGIYTIGNKNEFSFTAAAGVFPFKYDMEAKNLGEYLFRTGEHPAYIQTSFDDAFATMTGLRLNAGIGSNFSVDLLFTQETQIIPVNDWSLSVLAGYKVPHLLDVGAGIMFDRLIPVGGKLDEPGSDSLTQNTYYTGSGMLDTIKWGGTKVMARASFDPKGLLPPEVAKIFGKEDGIIYGEAAVLGLNSFSAYQHAVDSATHAVIPGKYVIDSAMNFYSDITRRIPVMFGMNIPTFKVLDFLSAEFEWYGWDYSPSLYNYENSITTLPQPIIPEVHLADTTIHQLYVKGNNWKYSFNFRRSILGNLSIIGQVARDHTRHDTYYNGFADPEEVFIQKGLSLFNGEWGWWLKVQYSL